MKKEVDVLGSQSLTVLMVSGCKTAFDKDDENKIFSLALSARTPKGPLDVTGHLRLVLLLFQPQQNNAARL